MLRNNMSLTSGPLMSEHLQDLDRELDLLRKKRQMIEQRQKMLVNERKFDEQQQYSYNKSHQMFGQQDPGPFQQFKNDYNFLNYYDQRHDDNFVRPGSKRQSSDQFWQTNVPYKRFAGSKGSKQRVSGSSRSQPLNRKNEATVPKSLLELDLGFQRNPISASNKFRRTTQKPIQATITKTSQNRTKSKKITKPKQASVPNKLHTHAPNKVRDLVAAASNLVEEVEGATTSNIFYVDKEPTNKMVGRMELALGAILKEIKAEFSETQPSAFSCNNILRLIKQNIRERIRNVMIGKPIGKLTDIVQIYRTKFPKETDKELVEFTVDCVNAKFDKNLVLNLEDSDNPENYFETNVKRLLRKRLDVMFKKLKTIYEDEFKSYKLKTNENKTLSQENNLNNTDQNDNTAPDLKDVTDDLDCSVIIVEDPNSNSANVIVIDDDEKGDVACDKFNTESDEVKASEVVVAKQDEDQVSNAGSKVIQEKHLKPEDYEEIVDKLIAQKLPQHLSLIKRNIVEVLRYDHIFRYTRASIIMNTKTKLQPVSENKIAKDVTTSSQKNDKPETKSILEAPIVIPYYVRITGKPYLPKKKVMQKFLSEFNPRSIKKHKTLPHLLFVGLLEKENYDRILAANDTMIGNSKISVRISERVNQTNKQESQQDVDSSLDNVISSDLDEKITELISSIRKEQEEMEMESSLECETSENEAGKIENKAKVEDKETEGNQNDNGVAENESEKIENNEVAKNATEFENNTDGLNTEKESSIYTNLENSSIKVNLTKEDNQDQGGIVQDLTEENNLEEEGIAQDVTEEDNQEQAEIVQDLTEEDNQGQGIVPDQDQKLNNDNKQTVAENTENGSQNKSYDTDSKVVTKVATRASTRLAATTPSTITTRRTSKLVDNN